MRTAANTTTRPGWGCGIGQLNGARPKVHWTLGLAGCGRRGSGVYFNSVTMKLSKVTFALEVCSSLQVNRPTAPLV